MNRREMIIASSVTVAAASLAATPLSALTRARYIAWEPGAYSNPHAELAARWCHEQANAGLLYTRTEFMDRWVKLTDPQFKIVPGAPVWNWMTGDTKESGLGIFVSERGIPLGSTRIATSIGYEEYWEETGKDRDMERYPDYFVRRFWMNDDIIHQVGEVLGRDHVGYDMRWLESANLDANGRSLAGA